MDEKFPLALPEGTILAGQYKIEKVLGQGGFGITYRADDHKTGQKVAVKEFFPDTLAYREVTTVISYPGERSENYTYGKESFLQEAQTLAAFIGNENIVRIHSYFEENGTAYFVMDYIEGKSFDEYIKERGGKIGVEEAKRILIPMMDALNIVHSKGIVHRDVTPDNIYITNAGIVKLLDFGAARYSLGDKSRSLDVILKHGFAPKEQYTRRGKQGPFTDIYSLGATFYFAITGKRPPDSVERLDEDDLIPPSNLGVDITEYQESAILQALSVQPADRFQTMADFKRVLLNENTATNQIFFTAPETTAAQSAYQAAPTVRQISSGAQQYYSGTQQGYPTAQQSYQGVQNDYSTAQQDSSTVQQASFTGQKVTQMVQKAEPLLQKAESQLQNAGSLLQSFQQKPKEMKNKKLVVGIACALVVVFIVGIVASRSSRAGFGSPEEAFEAYLNGFSQHDFDLMLKAYADFAIEYYGGKVEMTETIQENYNAQVKGYVDDGLSITYKATGHSMLDEDEAKEIEEEINFYYDADIDLSAAATVDYQLTVTDGAAESTNSYTGGYAVKYKGRWYYYNVY